VQVAAKKQRAGAEKKCSRCQKLKTLAEFPRNKAMADGLAVYCRSCKRESARVVAKGTTPEPKLQAPKPKNLAVPAKGRRGPVSGITPELTDALCEHLRRGHTRRAAARKAGVNEDTLASWLKRGAEEKTGEAKALRDAVLEAEGEGEFQCFELIREAAELDPVQARWILERRYSLGAENWARKEHIEVAAGPTMPEVTLVRELLTKRLEGLIRPPARGGEGPAVGAVGQPRPDEAAPAPPDSGASSGATPPPV
jgi:transposase-like protein